MQENASLRAQVSQAEEGRIDVEKQLIETQSRVNEVICPTAQFSWNYLDFISKVFSFLEKLFKSFGTICRSTVFHCLMSQVHSGAWFYDGFA